MKTNNTSIYQSTWEFLYPEQERTPYTDDELDLISINHMLDLPVSFRFDDDFAGKNLFPVELLQFHKDQRVWANSRMFGSNLLVRK